VLIEKRLEHQKVGKALSRVMNLTSKIFGNDGLIHVYVWQRAREHHNIENIVPSVKHGSDGITV